jgi:hypothetical protein
VAHTVTPSLKLPPPIRPVAELREANTNSSEPSRSSVSPQTSPETQDHSVPPPEPSEVTTVQESGGVQDSHQSIQEAAIQEEEEVPQSQPEASEDDFSSTRRTTRSRKPVNYVPTLGTAATENRPLTRRKQPIFPVIEHGPFSGMTATALRALTSSNTEKNQHYIFATLETQVIRKDGPRPESPVMKASQRPKNSTEQQRQARAKRRARRSGEGGSSDIDDSGQEDGFGPDEAELQSRHKRGAGETEDYATPARPGKRLRFDGDENTENENTAAEEKRVKWDKGLLTEVFIDEIHPRTQARPFEGAQKKGCLAPTAKVSPDSSHISTNSQWPSGITAGYTRQSHKCRVILQEPRTGKRRSQKVCL